VKSFFSLALSVVIALTGCGDSTTASTRGSTSDEILTDGASQTSNIPTTGSDNSASGSAGSFLNDSCHNFYK